METFYEVMRRKGISRRSLLKYCSLTATSLGLAPSFVPQPPRMAPRSTSNSSTKGSSPLLRRLRKGCPSSLLYGPGKLA
mgnify:CR=1 FL=1